MLELPGKSSDGNEQRARTVHQRLGVPKHTLGCRQLFVTSTFRNLACLGPPAQSRAVGRRPKRDTRVLGFKKGLHGNSPMAPGAQVLALWSLGLGFRVWADDMAILVTRCL